MWYVADNHDYMCHLCAKGFLNSNFNGAVIDKISIFKKLTQISHIHKNLNVICGRQSRLYVSPMCKRIFNSNFNGAVIDKVSNFQEIDPNFTYSQKS